MNLETGWTPSIEEYHALAKEGVLSSSMLRDLMPPGGRPRIYKQLYVDKTLEKGLVGVDAWRGSIVDCVLTEGGYIGYMDQLGCRGVATADGRCFGVIPPKFDMRKTKPGGDVEKWEKWKKACAANKVGLIGMYTDRDGKVQKKLADANKLFDEVAAIADFITEGKTPAAELARELLQGESGVSQLSHRFEWNDIDCRWRPDRIYQWDPQMVPSMVSSLWDQSAMDELFLGKYAHVSLKVTKDAHPGAFWANYQRQGWGMRDAFYELGWASMVSEQVGAANLGDQFPWAVQDIAHAGHDDFGDPEGICPWSYQASTPIDWIVIAAHHQPTPEVFVHVVPESQRRLGRKRCTEALQLLEHCMDNDDWTLPEERAAQLGRDPRAWEWTP